MGKKMNLRESILDAIVDDSESIVQIKNYLNYLEIPYTDELLKDSILELLNESVIKIVYPPNRNIIDVTKANNIAIIDYWFELTEKGREEWNIIQF